MNAPTLPSHPERFDRIARYEQIFSVTIHRTETVGQRAYKGTTMVDLMAEEFRAHIADAMGHEYPAAKIHTGQNWPLPVGAFKETGGPS